MASGEAKRAKQEARIEAKAINLLEAFLDGKATVRIQPLGGGGWDLSIANFEPEPVEEAPDVPAFQGESMVVYGYPAKIAQDSAEDRAFHVSFRDIPEAISQGDSYATARSEAVGALTAAVEGYVKAGRRLPVPSIQLDGERIMYVQIPADFAPAVDDADVASEGGGD